MSCKKNFSERKKKINSTDENILEKKKKIKGLSQCYVCLGKGKYIELLRV